MHYFILLITCLLRSDCSLYSALNTQSQIHFWIAVAAPLPRQEAIGRSTVGSSKGHILYYQGAYTSIWIAPKMLGSREEKPNQTPGHAPDSTHSASVVPLCLRALRCICSLTRCPLRCPHSCPATRVVQRSNVQGCMIFFPPILFDYISVYVYSSFYSISVTFTVSINFY